MTLQTLLTWWGLFLVSNLVLGVSVGMMVGSGPFARRRVSPGVATFLFICGMTLMLVAGKQNLLQQTINFVTGG